MKSHLQGQLRNFSLPLRSGLVPLFEAVVNSIHAIEERFHVPEDISRNGRIDIYIERGPEAPSLDLGPGRRPERSIIGFKIVDNGIGFTDSNWAAFNHLHYTEKHDKGCRGVGRLTWLKAFERVHVESHYRDTRGTWTRAFDFSRDEEVTGGDPERASNEKPISTCVRLSGFLDRYARAVEKTPDAIASRLLEHTLSYFVRSTGVPKIRILDEQTDTEIDLRHLFDQQMLAGSEHREFRIKEVRFDITHVKFRARADRKHVLAYCAGQRLVSEEVLDIPGLSASLSDEAGLFRYAGYVVSDFLDQRVVAERTGFDIEDDVEDLLTPIEITRRDIRDAAKPLIIEFLGDSLTTNIEAGRKCLDHFVKKTAPQYIPIVRYVGRDNLYFDPSVSDAQLDRELHTQKYQVQQTLLSEGAKLLKPDLSESYETYTQRLRAYLERLQSVKQSDLAAYVTHRRVVLDLLSNALTIKSDGTFERESLIHNLIMPMGSTHEDLEYLRGSNLWLLNERLAFHQHYLGSDKSLSANPITGATGGKEPDIVAMNIYDNPHAFSDTIASSQATITVVEIKKPMRSGYAPGEDKDPIEQALGYLRRIREGGVMSKTGRPIRNAENLPGYIYVLADLTPSMRARCDYAALHEAPGGQSYFGWNPSRNIKAYIEVIDFGGLLDAANQRNAAFFEFLGLPNER